MAEEREQSTMMQQPGNVPAWWGVMGNRVVEDRLQRFDQLASGLHRAYSEALHDQLDALSATNDWVTRSVQGFFLTRRPDEFLAMETEVLTDLMKAASLHMKTWTDLTQKVQGCYLDLARETTSDIGQEAREATSEVQDQVQQTMRATRQRTRRAAEE